MRHHFFIEVTKIEALLMQMKIMMIMIMTMLVLKIIMMLVKRAINKYITRNGIWMAVIISTVVKCYKAVNMRHRMTDLCSWHLHVHSHHLKASNRSRTLYIACQTPWPKLEGLQFTIQKSSYLLPGDRFSSKMKFGDLFELSVISSVKRSWYQYDIEMLNAWAVSKLALVDITYSLPS